MAELPETMLGWTKVRPEEDGFELLEHPLPSPRPEEILVKTLSTSICGSDIHIWKWDEWAQQEVPLGTVTGHETCGHVVALGKEVTSHKIGDFISVECHLACWKCPRCEEGNAHVCEEGSIFGVHSNGAFAPYFTILASSARHNPAGLDPAHGSIQDPLGNAIHTLTGGPVKGANVAIHGLGPIGLFAVDVARNMGAAKIIATDWDNSYRMDIARRLGADIVLSKEHDVVAEILEATDGAGADNSCEFSGAPAALSNAIKSTRMGGYLNILGVYGSDPKVPINEIVFRYLHVKGINGRRMWATWDTMQELLVEGGLDIESVLSHRMPWTEYKQAIALMVTGKCGKVVLDFDQS